MHHETGALNPVFSVLDCLSLELDGATWQVEADQPCSYLLFFLRSLPSRCFVIFRPGFEEWLYTTLVLSTSGI
jgi:hypothetical protein